MVVVPVLVAVLVLMELLPGCIVQVEACSISWMVRPWRGWVEVVTGVQGVGYLRCGRPSRPRPVL